MINFAHIAPTHNLKDYTSNNGIHLLLAHLVEEDEEYRNYYANLNDGKEKILDNSAFEMYKQNKPMYDSSKLIEMGKQINADYIVMSDYPGERGQITIDKAIEMIPQIKKAGFKTFFVPQSEVGDLEDYLETFYWGLNNKDIDLIGLSILGAPNAFGVERDNKLQRFMSRLSIFEHLESRRMLSPFRDSNKIHMLGMTDGPYEIKLVKDYHNYIYSWDTSSAVWAGINGVRYDNSPTGLLNGKFEIEVDFSSNIEHNKEDVYYNQKVWDDLLHPCFLKDKIKYKGKQK